MVQISQYLTPSDRQGLILPIILDSMRDQEDEERRLTSVVLVDELAETLGEELCKEHLLYDLVSLQDDSAFKVRRELVTRTIRVSKVLGEQIFLGVIIPVFRKLSQDSIWSVRKACVEVLPEISKIASEEVKQS
jgi:hypothetical protein